MGNNTNKQIEVIISYNQRELLVDKGIILQNKNELKILSDEILAKFSDDYRQYVDKKLKMMSWKTDLYNKKN